MPFEIAPFVLAMFISVEALRSYAITATVGGVFNSLMQQSTTVCVLLYGFASAFSSNILNNIPLTVAFVPVIQTAAPVMQLPAIYATVIGSNLGCEPDSDWSFGGDYVDESASTKRCANFV